jgi:hypothetical protein
MSKHTRNHVRRRRPRLGWLLLALASALLLGTAAFWAWRSSLPPTSTNASGTPSLKADKEKVDLGDVRLGQTVSVAFELTNTGAAPLRFREAPYVEVVEGC